MTLLTTMQAADYLGIKPNTLAKWRCQRTGPRYISIGRAIRYSLDDLDRFIDKQTTLPCNLSTVLQ